MNRVVLGVPVCLVGLSLLAYLLVNQSPADGPRPVDNPLPEVTGDGPLPDNARMEQLARTDQVAFLKNCLRRYQRDVQGYTLVMQKQERTNGYLNPTKEVIDVWLREEPHSVLMKWRAGARLAEAVLWVEGENDGKMLVRPNGFASRLVAGDVTLCDVDGPEARKSGRFPINRFGLRLSLERALASWQTAQDHHALHTEFHGLERLALADDRLCFHIRRIGDEPEGDGVLDQVLYIDQETWLPLGIIARGQGGALIGEYYFRQIHLNPEFKPGQFERAALAP
jgi:hypothetical protein